MTPVLKLKTPGERLRAIRAYCSPSRNDFCSKTGMSESTLKAWENDVALLTKKGARSLVSIFGCFGVFCTVEWLLNGEEPSPLRPYEGSHGALPEEQAIEKEYDRISNYYAEDSLLYRVPDQHMSPFFKTNDFVGGLEVSLSTLPYFWDEIVLAKTEKDQIYLRQLSKGSQPGLFTLIALNLPENHAQHKIEDISLKKAYRIVWHRTPIVQATGSTPISFAS